MIYRRRRFRQSILSNTPSFHPFNDHARVPPGSRPVTQGRTKISPPRGRLVHTVLIKQYSTSPSNAVVPAFKRLNSSKRHWPRINSNNAAHISGALRLEDLHEIHDYEEVFIAVTPIWNVVEFTRSDDSPLGVADLNQAARGRIRSFLRADNYVVLGNLYLRAIPPETSVELQVLPTEGRFVPRNTFWLELSLFLKILRQTLWPISREAVEREDNYNREKCSESILPPKLPLLLLSLLWLRVPRAFPTLAESSESSIKLYR